MAITKSREESLRNMVRGIRTILEANGKNHNNADVVFQSVVNAQKFGLGAQIGREDKDFLKVCIPEIIAAAGTIAPQPTTVVSPEGGAAADSQKVGGESITPVGVGGEESKVVEPEVVEEMSWKDLYSLDKDTGEFKINLSKVVGGAITLLNDKNSLKRAAAAGSSKALKVGIHKALRSEFEEQVVEKRPQKADAIERGVCNIVDSFLSQLFG